MWLRRALALTILTAWAGEYLADVVLGIWSVRYDLPLQLTDAMSLVSAFALWTQISWAIELAYLWAMTASLQAVLTPDLAYAFPSVFYFTYYTYHCGAIVAACLLVFGERRRIAPRGVARAYLAALAWACVAGAGDLLTGGNYMYLRAKPEHVSLLNAMGAWPWYVLETALVLAPALLWLAWAVAAVAQRLDPAPAP